MGGCHRYSGRKTEEEGRERVEKSVEGEKREKSQGPLGEHLVVCTHYVLRDMGLKPSGVWRHIIQTFEEAVKRK